jgi:phosphoglycolate phosphatase-like HAD superfamily hydrolase
VLWDIDHTLIATRGVGRELSALAFERTLEVPMRTQARIDGITEAVIFRETARLHGIETTRRDFERFAAALTAAHVEHGADLRERGHALPGAALVLDRLAAVPGVVQTVVTGNVRAVAEIKLAAFGLDRPIRWNLGAYGEDADERADLVRLALHRAGDVDPADAVLLGDTPADATAGRDAGVPVIGVATGGSSAEELHEAGAARVLPDLTDADRVVDWVGAVSP